MSRQNCLSAPSILRRLPAAAAALAGMLCFSPAYVAAQTTGPQTPAEPPKVVRIPNNPGAATSKPDIPEDEIIRRFSAQEDEFARAFLGYAYRKSVIVEEMGDDGKVAGRTEVTTTPVVSPDGVRNQRAVGEPESTLKVLSLERDDLEALSKIPLFPFGTAQLSKYHLLYRGKEPVDELTTYVFRVTPRQLDRAHAYFSGVIWVDDHDLAIVKTYGKWVTETGDVSGPQLPFTLFETYRQPVANKYWLPAYSRSDSSVSRKDAQIPVRLIIRWDQYTPAAPQKPAPTPATPSAKGSTPAPTP